MNNWENKLNSLEQELKRLRETSENIRPNLDAIKLPIINNIVEVKDTFQ